jgi:hypothetical protein
MRRRMHRLALVALLSSTAYADEFSPPSETPPVVAAAPALPRFDIRLAAGVGVGRMKLSERYTAATVRLGLEGEWWASRRVAIGLRFMSSVYAPWSPNATDDLLDHETTIMEPQLLTRTEPRRFGPLALTWLGGVGLGAAQVQTVKVPPGIPSDDLDSPHSRGKVIASDTYASGSLVGAAQLSVGRIAATAAVRAEGDGSGDRAVTLGVGLGVAL